MSLRLLTRPLNIALVILFPILIISIPEVHSDNTDTQKVDVVFDTNLPSSGYPLPYEGYVGSAVGWYLPVLNVDGMQVGFVDVHSNQVRFMGPVKFSWEVGSTHSYSWASNFLGHQRWNWKSTSGLASGQTGTITVQSNGTIIANYMAIMPPSVPLELTQGTALVSDCGGLNFVTPSTLPGGVCHHDKGDRYFLFKFGGQPYYAVVKKAFLGNNDNYMIQQSGDKVFLYNSLGANYDLYIYDSGQNLIGSSTLGIGTTDSVTVTPQTPILPEPSTGQTTQFDGEWSLTLIYSGYGQTATQPPLTFYVTNGVINSHNILGGTVDSWGDVTANYSGCIMPKGNSGTGIIAGMLRVDGTGLGTFSCGSQYTQGKWVAIRTGTPNVPSTTTPTPPEEKPAQIPTPSSPSGPSSTQPEEKPAPPPVTTPQTTPQPSTKYQTYTNSDYDFSLDYPIDWSYNADLPKNGNGFVRFTPNEKTVNIVFQATLIKDDTSYRGLQDQEYLNTMITNLSNGCAANTLDKSGFSCSDFKLLGSTVENYEGGFGYSVAYSWKEILKNGATFSMGTLVEWLPDGNNRWILAEIGTLDKLNQHKEDLRHMGTSFKLDNFKPPVTWIGSAAQQSTSGQSALPIIRTTPQDIFDINQAMSTKAIASEINIVNQTIQTTTIDNSISVEAGNTSDDSIKINATAYDQTSPKVILLNFEASTVNVMNLKYLDVTLDGKPIAPAIDINSLLGGKSTDDPKYAVIITQGGAQILILIPHFSTHTIIITNISKAIVPVPEFPFSPVVLFALVIGLTFVITKMKIVNSRFF